MTVYNIRQNYAGLRAGDQITIEGEPDEILARGIKGGLLVAQKAAKPKKVEADGDSQAEQGSDTEDS